MSANKLLMSWNDRFALIDHYTPSDGQVCAAFGVSQDELNTARSLRQAGTFGSSHDLDVSKYTHVFANAVVQTTTSSAPSFIPAPVVASANKPAAPTPTQKVEPSAIAPVSRTATVHTKPETASRKVKVPQKRGRKGDKITKALAAVPTTPMSVDIFIKEHGISLAVLRQSKRFIEKLDPSTAKSVGRVNVRQDKTTKQLMIWREVEGE